LPTSLLKIYSNIKTTPKVVLSGYARFRGENTPNNYGGEKFGRPELPYNFPRKIFMEIHMKTSVSQKN